MGAAFGYLPSFRLVARAIILAMQEPKLVTVRFPRKALAETWWPHLQEALLEQLQVLHQIGSVLTANVESDPETPLRLLGERLYRDLNCVEALLQDHGDPPIFMVCSGPEGLPAAWDEMLSDVLKHYKRAESGSVTSMICLVLTDGAAPPSAFDQSTAIREFLLWNPITWEEVRLIARDRLQDETNEIRKAWMISTYSAAAGCSLNMLSDLCEERPATTSEAVDFVFERLGGNCAAEATAFQLPPSNLGRPWIPPASMLGAWETGQVIGAFIERGLQRAGVIDATERTIAELEHQIWKEQVSGLFALLLEISKEAAELVFERYGSDWLSNGRVAPEPGAILDKFPTARFGELPYTLKKLLKGLRTARNRLAHLQPLERADLEVIWDQYVRAKNGMC